MCRQGISRWRGNGLQTGDLKVKHLGWAWGCKGNVVSHGRDCGGSSGVCIACEAVGYQCIWRFGEDLPYPMVTWLVEEIQSWVIRNMDCGLVQIL